MSNKNGNRFVVYHPVGGAEAVSKLFTCFKCGHTWNPRKRFVRICPKCKTVRWNIVQPGDKETALERR